MGQIFLIQKKYGLKIMYKHMVGKAASVVSPFYAILLGVDHKSCLKPFSSRCRLLKRTTPPLIPEQLPNQTYLRQRHKNN